MMSKPTFRRFIAYIIDIIIISLIVGAFSSIRFLNPKLDEYNEAQKQYQDYITELSMTKYQDYITELSMTNPAGVFSDEKAQNLSYDVTYYGVYTSIISLVVTFLYFSVFQYYTKGKTIGKLAMGIELISTDNYAKEDDSMLRHVYEAKTPYDIINLSTESLDNNDIRCTKCDKIIDMFIRLKKIYNYE